MTPDERKRSRINKSTLWYIKKNLIEDKTSKIYEKILSKIQDVLKKENRITDYPEITSIKLEIEK